MYNLQPKRVVVMLRGNLYHCLLFAKKAFSKLLTSISVFLLGSAPLGSYTPMKGSVASNFELGVTKSPSPGSSSVSMSPSPTQSKEEQARNGDNSLNGGDPESLQYLKPASDEETVAWSEGTRATDMLF